jgi:hypothetical protein
MSDLYRVKCDGRRTHNGGEINQPDQSNEPRNQLSSGDDLQRLCSHDHRRNEADGNAVCGHLVRRKALADDVQPIQKKNDRNEGASSDLGMSFYKYFESPLRLSSFHLLGPGPAERD